MKVIHLSHSDINGGAARAAYRIHHALRQSGVDSRMWVNSVNSDDWTVEGPESKFERALAKIRLAIGQIPRRLLKTENLIMHSSSCLPSSWVKKINNSDADVVHMHWVAREMLSIRDIGSIRKPVVWTFHDMWAFCGAEHVTEDLRWKEGYTIHNRPSYESGFDLNRWAWKRKRKYWKEPMQIVTPSRWLAQCVKQSELMGKWPVSVIPNTLDVEKWRPADKLLARQFLHLSSDTPLLLFGAIDGGRAPHKGFDLLIKALKLLSVRIPKIELIVFGQLSPEKPLDVGVPVHYTGHLYDDISLRMLYSAADALVVPSKLEAFGQTASEAHSCATPVIGFKTSGLLDIVDHEVTGYLAKAFEPADLAKGIEWVMEDRERLEKLGGNARQKAEENFAYPIIGGRYNEVYEDCIREWEC